MPISIDAANPRESRMHVAQKGILANGRSAARIQFMAGRGGSRPRFRDGP